MVFNAYIAAVLVHAEWQQTRYGLDLRLKKVARSE